MVFLRYGNPLAVHEARGICTGGTSAAKAASGRTVLILATVPHPPRSIGDTSRRHTLVRATNGGAIGGIDG
jgi:hypothetical protein